MFVQCSENIKCSASGKRYPYYYAFHIHWLRLVELQKSFERKIK